MEKRPCANKMVGKYSPEEEEALRMFMHDVEKNAMDMSFLPAFKGLIPSWP